MRTRNDQPFVIMVFLTLLSLILSSCSPAPTVTPTPKATARATPTAVSLPKLTLKTGDNYFSVDGTPSFIFSRNIAGYGPNDYQTFLDWMRTGGSRVARIQLDSLGMGYTPTGALDQAWAAQWDRIIDSARVDGIYIMPVFGVWYDWNDGNGYSTWKSNPLNAVNGGPASTPADLFITDSPTQKQWFSWMKTLVDRWQGRENIIAWEIFSEVNMAPGTTQSEAIDFVNGAALIIDNADTFDRPVTASLADFGDWSRFYQSDSIDFINIHPYPTSGKLDSTIVTEVRSMLSKYHKPVLIGESGLSFETPDRNPPTLTTADQAEIGINHAIWAAVVSGGLNGRALWWEDSIAIYFPALNYPFLQKYAKAELPAANFIRGVDFAGFQPLTSKSSSGVWGAAVGREKMVLGWYRDAASEPPDWGVKEVLSGQTVTITVPGTAANWQVDIYDTKNGTTILSSVAVVREGNNIVILLPDFQDDIAFKMVPK
jgi:hypothetical protein